MEVVNEFVKALKKDESLNNVVNCFKQMCQTQINNLSEEGYLFETMVEKNSDTTLLYFGLTRQFKTPKTGDEYYQIYVDLKFELPKNVKFGKVHWMFDDDRVFDINKFIKYVLKSKEYNYIIKNNLKLASINAGINEI